MFFHFSAIVYFGLFLLIKVGGGFIEQCFSFSFYFFFKLGEASERSFHTKLDRISAHAHGQFSTV